MSKIAIRPIGSHPAIRCAAEELARALERLALATASVEPAEAHDPGASGFWLGTADAFPSLSMPAVENPEIDDAVFIETTDDGGILAGSNPRSVLLAAYRYLTELGCRWVRPGADGERFPAAPVKSLSVSVREAASYRHRGICIEGAASGDNVRDLIDWMPKVGFNSYFIQFRDGYVFFDRWLSHLNNPLKDPEGFDRERARDLSKHAAEEAKRRDLIFHAVGHGWTCEPFGMPGLGWDEYAVPEAPPESIPFLAEVNGERRIWDGGPLNTNLCYSNPEAFRRITEDVLNYAEAHPEVDILHFWLADAANNQCECENCRDVRPSDFYLRMLNVIDMGLTARGLRTKVVFLLYVDLLWPPEKEAFGDPDRFVMMFAPITRSYSKAFSPEGEGETTPYVRNLLKFPRSVDDNLAYMKAWRERFAGDSFDFDYHFMWDHYNDPGYVAIAKILREDLTRLHEIGLNGFMSCQTQRAFFPTGFPMTLMGRTLWDETRGYEEIRKDYFRSAFGSDGEIAYAYLSRLSELFDPVFLRGEKPGAEASAAEALDLVPRVVAEFRPIIASNRISDDACIAASWRYLDHHADLCIALAEAFAHRARGDAAKAHEAWERTVTLVRTREDLFQPLFDVWLFQHTLKGRFAAPPESG